MSVIYDLLTCRNIQENTRLIIHNYHICITFYRFNTLYNCFIYQGTISFWVDWVYIIKSAKCFYLLELRGENVVKRCREMTIHVNAYTSAHINSKCIYMCVCVCVCVTLFWSFDLCIIVLCIVLQCVVCTLCFVRDWK